MEDQNGVNMAEKIPEIDVNENSEKTVEEPEPPKVDQPPKSAKFEDILRRIKNMLSRGPSVEKTTDSHGDLPFSDEETETLDVPAKLQLGSSLDSSNVMDSPTKSLRSTISKASSIDSLHQVPPSRFHTLGVSFTALIRRVLRRPSQSFSPIASDTEGKSVCFSRRGRGVWELGAGGRAVVGVECLCRFCWLGCDCNAGITIYAKSSGDAFLG